MADTMNSEVAPGTIVLEDAHHASKVILNPVPTDDPNDPLNWSKPRKAVNFVLVNLYTLITFVLLDIGTVAYGPYEAIGISYAALNDAWALNYAGLATGCILFIPFVYKYGRRPVYIVSILIQFASTIWNAKLSSSGSLLAAYTISGIGGAISETIVQITIADLFFVHQRATANGIFLTMQNMGAFLGPVCAGYIVVNEGWRWMWWWSAIILAVIFVLVLFFFEESKFVPTLVGQTVAPVPVQETDKPDKRAPINMTSIEVGHSSSDDGQPMSAGEPPVDRAQYKLKSYSQRLAFITRSDDSSIGTFKDHVIQPFVVMFSFPAILYAALTYGALLAWYSVITTVESYILLEPPYNWDSAGIGLLQLAPFTGSVIGAIIGGPLNDYAIVWLSKRNKGVYEPEMRLWMSLPTIIMCPLGILMFGIGLANGVSWVVLAVGWAINNVAMSMALDVALTYVTDCYQDIIGTALVAIVFARNGISIPIMFLVTPWVDNLGIKNCFISLAVLSFAFQLLPIPLLIWGKKARIATAKQYRELAKFQPSNRAS